MFGGEKKNLNCFFCSTMSFGSKCTVDNAFERGISIFFSLVPTKLKQSKCN